MKKRMNICLSLMAAGTLVAQLTADTVMNTAQNVKVQEGASTQLASSQPQQGTQSTQVRTQGRMTPRDHYAAIIEEASKSHWAVPLSVYFNIAHEAFGKNGQITSLTNAEFGTDAPIRFRDISLISRLSDDGKVHSQSRDLSGGSNVNFPELREHQWLALLASTEVSFGDVEKRETCFNISGIYRWALNCDETIEAAVGITLPIQFQSCSMDLCLKNGSIIDALVVGTQDQRIIRNNALVEFFDDFEDVKDWFVRGILEPKGLTFDGRQRKSGFGDLSLFGLVDFGSWCGWTDSFEVGMNVLFPTGSKACGNKLCELELGNGGGYQVELFTQILFTSCLSAFNPVIRVAGGFSPSSFTSNERIPLIKRFTHHEPHSPTVTDTEALQQIPGLIGVPPSFGGGVAKARFTDSYEEVDSLIPAFADHAFRTRVKRGSQYMVTLGNYFYNVAHVDLRLGIFYDYYSKQQDKFNLGKCTGPFAPEDFGDFVKCGILECTEVKAHNISWNLTYKFANLFELGIGSQHTFAGRNVAKKQEGFVTFVAVF